MLPTDAIGTYEFYIYAQDVYLDQQIMSNKISVNVTFDCATDVFNVTGKYQPISIPGDSGSASFKKESLQGKSFNILRFAMV